MQFVVFGLGSNVGERALMLERAVQRLSALLKDMRRSSVMETPALLPEGAPPEWDMPFLNMAMAGKTALSPRELLQEAKRIEAELGRKDRGHWGPREIDIDILAYGEQWVEEEGLRVPHPELFNREFAWKPFAEVAPGLLERLRS